MAKLIKEIEFYCKSNPRKYSEEEAYPAFPVDAEREDKSTPMYWSRERKYNNETKEYDMIEGFVVKFNNRFKDVKIKSLEQRSGGGRAYKVVITEDNKRFLVDLREKALMDTILNVGIEPGGKLSGEYTFIKEGAQTNLVRIDSKEYNELVNLEKVKAELTTIPTKELKPMTLYKIEPSNKRYIFFIGEIYVPQVEVEDNGIDADACYGSEYPMEKAPKLIKLKKMRMYVDMYLYNGTDDKEELKEEVYKRLNRNIYYMEVKPTFKVHTEMFAIGSVEEQSRIMETYHKESVKELEDECKKFPKSYSYWGIGQKKSYLSSKRFKEKLIKACISQDKQKVEERFAEYSKYYDHNYTNKILVEK